jgi:hypothetical protein
LHTNPRNSNEHSFIRGGVLQSTSRKPRSSSKKKTRIDSSHLKTHNSKSAAVSYQASFKDVRNHNPISHFSAKDDKSKQFSNVMNAQNGPQIVVKRSNSSKLRKKDSSRQGSDRCIDRHTNQSSRTKLEKRSDSKKQTSAQRSHRRSQKKRL